MNAKFAVGDKVDLSPGDKFVGTVKAVFTTKEGETRYAVDVEGHGTLRLCSDHTIVPHDWNTPWRVPPNQGLLVMAL
jgi:hypothetical protein